MKREHAKPRVVVHAADPRVRSLIIRRLAADGDLEVVADGAPHQEGGALVEAETAAAHGDGAVSLTPREMEVLALVAEGMANKEIGFRLGISAYTARFHVESIFRKLSAANRAEAVREGIRKGLLTV